MQEQLMEILLAPQVIGLSAGIVAVLHFVGLIPLKKGTLGKHPKWRRFLPLLPLVLGIGGAFLMGAITGDEAQKIQTPIITGCWAGFVAAHGRKVLKRFAVDKLESKDS